MKSFIFKLQTALDIKVREEENQKEAVGKLQKFYQEQMNQLNLFEEKLMDYQNQLRKQQKESIELTKIRSYEEYLPVLHNKMSQQSAQVEKVLAEIHKARKVLVSLMQERKVLEKLKFKKYEEYRKMLLLEEQKSIDEMAMNTYLNKDLSQI